MIDLCHRMSYAGHRDQGRRGEREVENIDVVVGNLGRFPRLTVVNGLVVGQSTQLAPGGIGRTEAVDAVGVINNGDRFVLGQNSNLPV